MPKDHLPGQAFSLSGGHIFTIVKPVTQGNFAYSSIARDERGKVVFFKEYIEPTKTNPRFDAYVEFQKKLQASLAKSNESAVLTPLDLIVDDGRLFVIYPLLEGLSATDYLSKSPPPPLPLGLSQDAFYWTISKFFMYALSEIHEAKIVHSDLKPDNIFLKANRDARFGLNIQIIDLDWSFYEGRSPPWDGYMTTAGYQSPEHLQGTPPLRASDIFTAGIILYQFLTGARPDYHDTGFHDPKRYAEFFKNGAVPLASRINSDVPEPVSEELAAMLSWDPAERPNAEHVRQVLVENDPFNAHEAANPRRGAKPADPASRAEARGVRLYSTDDASIYVFFDKPATIGREDLLILSNSNYVSKVHLQLCHEEPHIWSIIALDSAKNNTRLNDSIVSRGESRPLKNGDVLEIGKFRARIAIET